MDQRSSLGRVVDTGLSISSRIGVREKFLDRLVSREAREDFDFSVDEAIARFDGETDRGTVLLPMIQGHGGTPPYFYCILAHAFRCRGYEPLLLRCHGTLPTCFRMQGDPMDELRCQLCGHYGDYLTDEFGLTVQSIDEYATETASDGHGHDVESIRRRGEYRGVDVEQYALASVRRSIKKYSIDRDDEYEGALVDEFIESGAYLVDLCEQMFDQEDVDAVLGHDPSYLYGGILLEIADSRGIPTTTFGVGHDDGTMIFGDVSNRSGLPLFTDEALLDETLSEPLDAEQRATTESIMNKREEGETVRVHYSEDANDRLETRDEAHTVGLFTNLMWDASLEAGGAAFQNPFEWIRETIDWFADHPAAELIIKTHPAEGLRESNEQVSTWVPEEYGSLPANVTLLEPDTDVDPYKLIGRLDTGIVYNSTIGLEMAHDGVPVVVVGDTHYRGLGFTEDPETRGEYRSLLEEDLTMGREAIDRARRYTHFLFTRKQIPVDVYQTEDDEIEIGHVTHEEIVNNEGFDRIVDGTMDGTPILRTGQ